MESELSYLSSLKEDNSPVYIQPHYKETYRLAIYALLCGGKEAYEEFLRAEQIHHFLSEEEILFILENAELPVVDDDSEAKQVTSEVSPSTYFPVESDEEVPDLELGWPEVSLEDVDTSISLLFHPPRQDTPSIKEVIRKQIQEAKQIIAIAMDIFTDIDIFKEIVSATLRGVVVYILLDETHSQSFLTMARKVGVNIQDLKNIRVRTVQGQQYQCQSGMKFHGGLEQKFILVDCRTVLYGTYSYTWSFEKINLSMVLVITGQLVCSYDEEFRRLFARSTVPAVQSWERVSVQNNIHTGAVQSPSSSQLSLHQIHMRSIGVHGMRSAQDASMLTRGLSVQDRLHQSHCTDLGNLLRGHSYGGELQKLNPLTRLRMGNKDIGGPTGPERPGSNLRSGDPALTNRLSQQHIRHRTLYGADENLIPFSSETSLHKWKMDTYLNDNMPLDPSCDALSPMTSPYSSYTGLNEYQSQMIHSRSRDINSRMEELRQKRLNLQDHSNLRQSQESLRFPTERPKLMSSLRGLDMSVAELKPNAQNSWSQERANHKDSEPNKEGNLTDSHQFSSHYDVNMGSDRKTLQMYDWHEPLSRTTSAGDLDMKLKEPSLKLSHLLPSGHNAQHGRAMESLTQIPEEKEGSNTRVNGSGSAVFQDGNEQSKHQDHARGSHDSVVKVSNSSGSATPDEGQKSTSKAVRTLLQDTSTGSQHTEEAKSSYTNRGKTQSEEPPLQRKNSLRMKVYSLLTSDEKKASKKEEKSLQRKGSLISNQPVKADHSQAPAVDQTPKKGQSPSISRSQNSVQWSSRDRETKNSIPETIYSAFKQKEDSSRPGSSLLELSE
ncbi:Protein FAM83B [Larimichthys crocea]|uniref:Protein FAM83B n=1 Tax=Larimichthys crocea TaxID=215358 RepID=A0A6G0JAU6_LARCR|nr:Protein FAM83B [Larimichthys crocea]